jgi:PPOX class probable F420-dependent enzyme
MRTTIRARSRPAPTSRYDGVHSVGVAMDDRIVVLARERYLSVTTYRRDGRAVATPVWFALDGTRILVWPNAASGKAKRVRANGRAAVAPCDVRGRTKRAPVDARASLLPAGEFARANRILSAKYRLLKPLAELWMALGALARRTPRQAGVFIELQLVDNPERAPR